MSSNRLPKKALADLNGKPAIIRMIQRVKKSQLIDKLVLATGKSNDNDVLEKLVKMSPSEKDDILLDVVWQGLTKIVKGEKK